VSSSAVAAAALAESPGWRVDAVGGAVTGVVAGAVAGAVSGLAEASACASSALPGAVGTVPLVSPAASAGPPPDGGLVAGDRPSLKAVSGAVVVAVVDAPGTAPSPPARADGAAPTATATAPALSARAAVLWGVGSCWAGLGAGGGVTSATVAPRDGGALSDLSGSATEADGPCSGNAVSAPSASTWASTEAATAQTPCRQRTGHGRAAVAPAGAQALA